MWDWLFGKKEKRQAQKDYKLSNATTLGRLLNYVTGDSGVVVTHESAMRSMAVFAAIRLLSDTLSSLPFRPIIEEGKTRTIDRTSSMYHLLKTAPNSEMTWVTFCRALMAHLVSWGNAYAEIERNGGGQVVGLWLLLPNIVEPRRNKISKKIEYIIHLPEGAMRVLPFDDVLHIPGLGFDGLIGYSPIQLAAQSIGLTLAAEKFGAKFFGAGTHPSGAFEHPGELGDDAYERLKKDLDGKSGLENAHRYLILEEGMKWTQFGVPPEQAQFLETRQFQVTDIARLFRVPPHMIGDLSRATFSNVEQESINFVVYSMTPWIVAWEQAFTFKTLTEAERRNGKTFKFNVASLLRGDTVARFNAYAIGRQWGWLSADDVRALEDMNPLPDGQGELYLTPMNMQPAGMVPENENPED